MRSADAIDHLSRLSAKLVLNSLASEFTVELKPDFAARLTVSVVVNVNALLVIEPHLVARSTKPRSKLAGDGRGEASMRSGGGFD